MAEDDDVRILKFSTKDIGERDRIPMWRDLFARSIVKVELDPSAEEPFRSDSIVHVLPDLVIRSSSASAATVHRTRELVADGDDNLVLAIMKKGRMTARQGDREVNIAEGGAYLWSNDSTGYSRNSSMELLTIAITRRSLEATVADLDRSLMRPIPAPSEPLQLLIAYVGILQSQPGRLSPPCSRPARPIYTISRRLPWARRATHRRQPEREACVRRDCSPSRRMSSRICAGRN